LVVDLLFGMFVSIYVESVFGFGVNIIIDDNVGV